MMVWPSWEAVREVPFGMLAVMPLSAVQVTSAVLLSVYVTVIFNPVKSSVAPGVYNILVGLLVMLIELISLKATTVPVLLTASS